MISRLQKMRESYDLTIAELSELSDISESAIRSIENGRKTYKTNVAVAKALADALDCRVSDLFDSLELSDLGRPPFTGKKIEHRHYAVAETLCPSCGMLVPADVGCEFCEQPSPIPVH